MIINDDCLKAMKQMEDNSIDFIVTDPPYGLNFMGKHWDGKIPAIEIWAEALRVCKPGSMLAAFGGSRTHHHLMLAIEEAGWEIRDVIMWLYGSGFPKSHNYFGLEGYGTALKPAYEPIILAMRPLDGTFKQNVEKWGIGGINIDGSRIPAEGVSLGRKNKIGKNGWANSSGGDSRAVNDPLAASARWPANIILDEEAGEILDEMSGILNPPGNKKNAIGTEIFGTKFKTVNEPGVNCYPGEFGKGASRFFYCAKASSKERNKGLDSYITVKYNCGKKEKLCHEENMVAVELLKKVMSELMQYLSIEGSGENILAQFHKGSSFTIKMKIKQIIESKILNLLMHSLTNEYIPDVNLLMAIGGNHAVNVQDLKKWILDITKGKMELAHGASNAASTMLSLISEEENWKEKTCSHPTVKPISLMKYIITLLAPPNKPTLLDPFAGSGSTLVAAAELGINAVGIEKEAEYCEIARNRVAAVDQPLFKFGT